MDATNMAVLAELKEYAHLYFSAIVEMHTAEGKCKLKPGKYSAKELVDNNKAACGPYALPEDPIFDGLVTISDGTFECEFPYRHIFAILAQWEAMSKAGKQKAVFEIGVVEERSAKVLLNEKTELGAFKTKRMKLQRVTGNWWMPRKYKENDTVFLYYELNGVMFKPGKFVIGSNLQHPSTKEWCKRYNDEEISKLLLSFLSIHRAGKQQDTPYFVEVANRANIGLQATETPRNPTETTEAVNVLSEEATPEQARILETSRIEHERKLREEEARALDEERKYIESAQMAKEKFVAGKKISVDELEMVAKSVGYSFTTQTVNTLRKKVNQIETNGEYVSMCGSKPRKGLDGLYAAIREIYALAVEGKLPDGIIIKQAYAVSDKFIVFKAENGKFFVGRESGFVRSIRKCLHGVYVGTPLYEVNEQTALFIQCRKHGENEKVTDFVKMHIADYAAAADILNELAKEDNTILPAPQSYQDEINAYKATQAHVEPAKLPEQTNVSIQGNYAPVKHISEIMEICRLYDEGGEKTDEYRYFEWLAGTQCGVYRTIADNALIEAFVRIFDAAYRKGKGHIVARNSQGVLIETVITTIEPSQPRKAKCVTDMPVLRKTAGKRAKRSALRTAKPQARSKTHGAASVPRSVLWIVPQGQTVVFHSRCYITYQFADVRKMAHTPPIRGDCVKIDGCTRDKSLCCADNDEINGLKLS